MDLEKKKKNKKTKYAKKHNKKGQKFYVIVDAWYGTKFLAFFDEETFLEALEDIGMYIEDDECGTSNFDKKYNKRYLYYSDFESESDIKAAKRYKKYLKSKGIKIVKMCYTSGNEVKFESWYQIRIWLEENCND